MTQADRLSPPDEASPLALADWAEALMILADARELASTEIRRRLRDTGLLEPELDERDEDDAQAEAEELGIDDNGAQREDECLEGVLDASPVIEMLLAEVARRRALAPCVYPWARGGAVIERVDPTPQAGLAYEFLRWLALDGTPFRRLRRWTEAEWAFDRIVVLALRGYLGPRSVALAFARPAADRQGPDVRPVSFPRAVEWLAGQLRLDPGTQVARAARNDGGVDVASWRPFSADASAGCPVILAQCTFRKGWHRKGRDIVIDTWRSWIGFAKDPITALAVPFLLADDDDRRPEVETEVWLVLDRMRICELLCDAGEEQLAGLAALGLATWLGAQVAAYDPATPEAAEDDDANAPDPYGEGRAAQGTPARRIAGGTTEA